MILKSYDLVWNDKYMNNFARLYMLVNFNETVKAINMDQMGTIIVIICIAGEQNSITTAKALY